ncbi:MAG: phage portal protein [Smithella sp.]|jgi:hypothetical protein
MPDNKDTALIPPQGDKGVGKRVYQVLAAVIADKISLGLPDMYNRNYKLRRNRHWKQASSKDVPLISANLIHTHITRSVNTLTDNSPTFDVSAKFAIDDGQSQGVAQDLQRVAEDWWSDTEQQTKLEMSVNNGEMYGICIENIPFNAEGENGLGVVETRIVDPMFFGWYPVKLKDVLEFQKSEAVVEYWIESTRKLKKKYPKLADKIKPDTDVIKELGDERRELSTGEGNKKANNLLLIVQSVVRSVSNYFKGTADINDIDSEETVVCAMYVRDDTRVNDGEQVKNEETGEVIQNTKLKYTGGLRYIVVCSGGEVVLEDRDNPNINPTLDAEQARETYLYSRFPYGVANSIVDTSNAWGITDLEDVEKLVMEINKALSQMILEKDKSARKKLINPLDSGVDNSQFGSYPAIIRPTSAQTAAGIKYLEVPQSNGDIEKSINLLKELFLMIAGTFDLDQAQTKSNVIAYKAIAALLERAATMMRGKIRNYSGLIRERGRMFVSHVQNFYTEDRWVTFKGENGQREGKQFKGSDLAHPVNLTVVAGSTLPISRVQQREEAIGLFEKSAIDQQELLDRLDVSNRDQIIKRMQAGPLGKIFELLTQVGVPAELMEYFKSIVEADPKKLQKAMESGEFPMFNEVLKEMITENLQKGGMPAEEKPPTPEETEATAKAGKLQAETALITAKVQTEAVNQEVALAGVQFDDDQMKIKRAEAVHGMESDIKAHGREDAKAGAEIVSKLNNKPGFNDSGTKSDNKKTGGK